MNGARLIWASAVSVIALSATAVPSLAQTPTTLVPRVDKLEREMRAVQRKVFPQGTPVQPDLSPAASLPTASGVPASAPLTDLTARVDAVEKQLATLTGASEQSGFRVRQLEEALSRLQARLTALEAGNASSTATPVPAAATTTPSATTLVRPTATAGATRPATPVPSARPTAKPTAAPVALDPARKALVAAVDSPATGDAAEDGYSYGFRLYTAKLLPEAQAKLKEFTASYPPTQRRWSYAQNLLGRAYLDEGKPALASVAFYDNYQKAPRGERAAESLYWLGQSLTKLKKLGDACKVYDEFADVYGAKVAPDLKARVVKGRVDAKCAT